MTAEQSTASCRSKKVEPVFVIFLACLTVAIGLRYQSLYPSVIDPDESLYLVMAQHWIQGELPYQTVWDQHSVGLPALFAAIQFLFPDSIVAIRLSAAVAVAVAATAVYLIGRTLSSKAFPAVFAAGVYIAWTSRSWGLPANCELYLNALTCVAICIVLRQTQISVGRLCMAAFLFGVALQIKHVIVVETLLFLIWSSLILSRIRQRKLIFVVVAALSLPSLIVISYFCSAGLLGTYLHAMVASNLDYAGTYDSVSNVLLRVPRTVMVPLVIIVVAGISIVCRPRRESFVVLSWAAAACADVVLPGQYWPHYFLLAMPAASVLVSYLANSFDSLSWSKRFPRLSHIMLSLLILLGSGPIGIYKDSVHAHELSLDDTPKAIAEHVRRVLQPTDYMFVFNYQPIVYWLTDSRLPTNHVFPGDWSRRFRGVASVEPVRELERVFVHRPEFVIVANKDLLVIGDEVTRKLEQHLRCYRPEFETLDRLSMREPVLVKVYRRAC